MKNLPITTSMSPKKRGSRSSRNSSARNRMNLNLSIAQEAKLIYAVPAGSTKDDEFKKRKSIIESINIENGLKTNKITKVMNIDKTGEKIRMKKNRK